MELQAFVEKTLTDIAEGVKAVNDKLDGWAVRHGEKVVFTVAVQATEESNKEGGANVGLKVLNIGGKQGKTSKDEVYNTVTFEAYFEKVEKEDPYSKLPSFKIGL